MAIIRPALVPRSKDSPMLTMILPLAVHHSSRVAKSSRDLLSRSSLAIIRQSQAAIFLGSVSHDPRSARLNGLTAPDTSTSSVMATMSSPRTMTVASICSRWRSTDVDSSVLCDNLVAPRIRMILMILPPPL